jgi:DHA1 family bicyclomycin/chloramphenicol resistance-like MFS transporter
MRGSPSLAEARKSPPAKAIAFDTPARITLLAVLAAMNALSVEIVLPAIVPIARDMAVTEETAAMLIGGYFLAFAIGQIVWGLASDAFGRKPILLIGLSTYLLCSAGAALSTGFPILFAFRIAQGFFGAAPILANAILRDVSSGQSAARTQAILAATVSVAPLLAPVFGSGILVLASWRVIFWVLAAIGLTLILIVLVAMPETLSERQPGRLKPGFVARRAAELWRNAQFRTGALVMAISFSGFSALLTMGSVVAENVYGIPPEAFGSVYMIVALATFAGVLLTRWLLKHITLVQTGAIALSFMAAGVILHGLFLFTIPAFPMFWGITAVYLFGFGMVYPTFTSYAFEAAGESKGFAASLSGAANMLGGFVTSLVITALYDDSHRVISGAMVVAGTLAILIFLFHRRKP